MSASTSTSRHAPCACRRLPHRAHGSPRGPMLPAGAGPRRGPHATAGSAPSGPGPAHGRARALALAPERAELRSPRGARRRTRVPPRLGGARQSPRAGMQPPRALPRRRRLHCTHSSPARSPLRAAAASAARSPPAASANRRSLSRHSTPPLFVTLNSGGFEFGKPNERTGPAARAQAQAGERARGCGRREGTAAPPVQVRARHG